MKVLVTCPPMLGMLDRFHDFASERGISLHPARVAQTLSEEELMRLLPGHEGWIIGDDPATRTVLEAARQGGLRAAVKWGIGVDNVDFEACRDLGIPVANTPNMFGEEVADVAMAYITGLARHLFAIDRSIRDDNGWPKPAGMSLAGKRVGLAGLGHIGSCLARRLAAASMRITAYDPGVEGDAGVAGLERAVWPERVEDMDFLVFTCSLNEGNVHMLDRDVLQRTRPGVFVVNVARGGLIHEAALVEALASGHVRGAALDVFEAEPLPAGSRLRQMERCVFGSHNSSNTREAVVRASHAAIATLAEFLRGGRHG